MSEYDGSWMQAKSAFSSWEPTQTPLLILAEGCFGDVQSKLALGVIRYGNWPIAAVLDSTRAGQTVEQVTGLPCPAPIVATLSEAMAYHPSAMLIGTAPAGGQLPPSWKLLLLEALQKKLHLLNGLHFFLEDDAELAHQAKQAGVKLWDVRNPEAYGHHKFQVINEQKSRPDTLQVVTMVGSDCSVGKMHTALELNRAAQQRGHQTDFIATGQTGILIAGRGIPLDRVIGDFMAGGLEVCIQEAIAQHHISPTQPPPRLTLFVEGQGSLLHPAYSGVTLSLLHGSNPDQMILCHKAGLSSIRNYPNLALPPISQLVQQYEAAAAWVRPTGQPKARVAGISVNTSAWPEPEARHYLEALSEETGLPATDPVRYGVNSLLEAIYSE